MAMAMAVAPPSLHILFAAILPALLVFFSLFFLFVPLPVPAPFRIFREFISAEDVLASEDEDGKEVKHAKPDDAHIAENGSAVPIAQSDGHPGERTPLLNNKRRHALRPPLWRTASFVLIGLVQCLAWLVVLSYSAVMVSVDGGRGEGKTYGKQHVLVPALVVFTWSYAALKSLLRPTVTPPYELLALFVLHALAAVLSIWAIASDLSSSPSHGWEDKAGLVLQCGNLLLSALAIRLVLGMPLQVNDEEPKKDDKGLLPPLEDYCTLWSWMTFNWMTPLIQEGTKRTLEEADVWQLSKFSRTKVLLNKFLTVQRPTLIHRLAVANAHDLGLDFALTVLSSILAYASPFFLKRILDSFEPLSEHEGDGDGARVSKQTAYLFTVAAFVCAVLKSQADLQHLAYGRRAGVRIKAELISSIYLKALKTKDVSGVTQGDDEPKEDKGKDKDKDKKKEEKKEEKDMKTADVGKIVSLMAGDAQRIAGMVVGLYMMYSAPVELVIACTFLYTLMGWSAFAGFAALLLALPLNHFLTKRQLKLSRSLLAAKDKRMSTMNEFVSSIKFIKFFAWERQWTDRVLDSRENELKWLVRRMVNMVSIMFLWVLAPSMVTVISFAVYVLLEKKELTVSVAFTAIALFNMLRGPLNIIPMMLNEILAAYVSVQRVESYLNSDDEVPDWVSSIKHDALAPGLPVDDRFGCEHASFRWHNGSALTKDEAAKKDKKPWLVRLGLRRDPAANDLLTAAAVVVEGEDANGREDEENDRPFALNDISITFPPRQLTLVCGPTGSGKSSLLAGILGEMDCLSGKVFLTKQPSRVDPATGLTYGVSYAAQTPWLIQQSIRKNILFGSEYDPVRYHQVLSACGLKPDLAILEDGDMTEIGERGVSLSGGQKARVALARAVYARTSRVLLDDVLAAVDSHTAEHIVNKCLRGPLMRHRTVVLVTHHIELVLPHASHVINVVDGQIEYQGSPQELLARGVLSEIMVQEKEAARKTDAEKEEEIEDVVEVDDDAESGKPARKLVEEEKKESGSVKKEIYHMYLGSVGYPLVFAILVLLFVQRGTNVLEQVWLKVWGESYENRQESFAGFHSLSLVRPHADYADYQGPSYAPPVRMATTTKTNGNGLGLPSAADNPVPYIEIYAAIQLAAAVIWGVMFSLGFVGALRATRKLFTRMLISVARAPSRFFDKTPSGRILNRFSKDVETLDMSMHNNLRQIALYVIGLVAAVGVLAYSVPPFILPALIIGYLHWIFARGYIRCGRDLRRLESVTRSPIFSSFGELLVGITTVRAYCAERRFLDDLAYRLDRTLAAWHYFWMSNRWLLFRFDLLGACSVLLASVFSLSGGISAGLAGMAITSAQNYVQSIYWLCRFFTAFEMDLNSVERVYEYLDLPKEPPAVIEGHRPPAAWPTEGRIVVDDLTISYDKGLPAVLHGVSFEIKPGEKVGLVGRTGSGKSTLALALFRFVDPLKGTIIIDGIDYTSIGVEDLRSRLTIVPQDSVLFRGTLRENLDPFGEHDDAELTDVLLRTQLVQQSQLQSRNPSRPTSKPASVRGLSLGDAALASDASSTVIDAKGALTLDSKVSEGGGNFSQGQRQLVSLARALLRNSKIVVLDEATSSVDFATDAKIQQVMRDELAGTTVLTIAHRLRTIIDFDKVLVLDAGRVVEFDSPYNLLNKKDGVFKSMCEKSGDFVELLQLAEASTGRS